MQVSAKKLIAINFLILLVVSMGMYAFASAPTSTFWVTSGAYPSGVTYTIWREGSNYHAKDGFGQLASFSGGTNISYISGLAGANGGKLFFLDGTYLFDAPFIVVSNTTIEGEGWNTILQWNAGDPATMRGVIHGSETGGTEENIIIQNIHIRGNGDASGAGHINLAGIYWNYTVGGYSVEHLSIDRVKFSGKLERGTHLEDSRLVSVTNSFSYKLQKSGMGTGAQDSVMIGNVIEGRGDTNEDNGIELIGDPNDPLYVNNVTIANNIIRNHYSGIELRVANNVLITGNKIINSLAYGMILGESTSSANPKPEYIQVTNNYVENLRASGYDGIRANLTLFDISGNTIIPDASGITLAESSNGTVSNNRIINGATGYAASAGIVLDGSPNNILSGNYMVDNNVPQEMGGIMETDATSDWNMIIGNNARFCQAPAIRPAGANTKVVACWNGSSWIATWP